MDAGFNSKDISVFMLYNYDLDYDELESKRVKCFEWKVQITDCRFRPLDEIKDNYSPHKRNGQTNNDYFIHENGLMQLFVNLGEMLGEIIFVYVMMLIIIHLYLKGKKYLKRKQKFLESLIMRKLRINFQMLGLRQYFMMLMNKTILNMWVVLNVV